MQLFKRNEQRSREGEEKEGFFLLLLLLFMYILCSIPVYEPAELLALFPIQTQQTLLFSFLSKPSPAVRRLLFSPTHIRVRGFWAKIQH